jgi:hypothetical protein
MSHPVVYPGDLDALVKKWKDEVAKSRETDILGLAPHQIANGECARLPQALTSVGHTSRWQPGQRVMDVRNLAPGTVIANFIFENGKARYPNAHGYHAALFVGAQGHSVVTGNPSQILMFDQWAGGHPKAPSVRAVRAYSDEAAKQQGKLPCDNANQFFVVMVP